MAAFVTVVPIAVPSCSTGPDASESGISGRPWRDGAAGSSVADAPAPRAPAAAPGVLEFSRLEGAIRRYAADRAGRLPATLEALAAERSPEGDRYLASVPLDPWGRRYAYAVVSARLGSYDLRSYGPDTLPATDDDLVADSKPVPVH